MQIRHDPVDSSGFQVIVIESKMVINEKKKDKTTGKAKGEAKNIQYRIERMFPQIPPRDPAIISEHNGAFEIRFIPEQFIERLRVLKIPGIKNAAYSGSAILKKIFPAVTLSCNKSSYLYRFLIAVVHHAF
jgi:hypothetical protein